MKLISIVTPCYNEEANINELYERIQTVMSGLDYSYEHIFIDNASTDNTVDLIRDLAKKDRRVKAILNTRNFGHIRSPYYGLLQGSGDVVVILASDLQDPPERIIDFIHKWEQGYKAVIGVKTKSQETGLFYFLRTIYYRFLRRLSDVDLIEHYTGFGLYVLQIIVLAAIFSWLSPHRNRAIFSWVSSIIFPRHCRRIHWSNLHTDYETSTSH